MSLMNESKQTKIRQEQEAFLTGNLTDKNGFRIETLGRLIGFLIFGFGGAWLSHNVLTDAVPPKVWVAMMFVIFGYEQFCARIEYSVRQIVADELENQETRTDHMLVHQHKAVLGRLEALKGSAQ